MLVVCSIFTPKRNITFTTMCWLIICNIQKKKVAELKFVSIVESKLVLYYILNPAVFNIKQTKEFLLKINDKIFQHFYLNYIGNIFSITI